MARITAEELIRIYDLKPHPEGGFFRESYRAEGRVADGHNYSTAIYFLLPAGHRSRLHRIKADELWHFYLGGPLTVAQIFPDGWEERAVLGADAAAGQLQQHAVPAGCWFGAYPEPGTEFSFVGCTVAPGFDFSDLELARRDDLLKKFPKSRDLIEKLA